MCPPRRTAQRTWSLVLRSGAAPAPQAFARAALRLGERRATAPPPPPPVDAPCHLRTSSPSSCGFAGRQDAGESPRTTASPFVSTRKRQVVRWPLADGSASAGVRLLRHLGSPFSSNRSTLSGPLRGASYSEWSHILSCWPHSSGSLCCSQCRLGRGRPRAQAW